MAGNEIKVLAALRIENGNFKLPKIGGVELQFDQTTAGGMVPGVVEIGTSEEDVDLSALTTKGWLWMRNLDDTNYVQWGKKDGSGDMQAIGCMEAGEPVLFRLDPGATLRMKADTAACKVQILANED